VDGWPQVLRVQWATPRPSTTKVTSQPQSELGLGQESPTSVDPLCYASCAEVEAQGLEPTRLFIGQIARDSDAGNLLRPVFEPYGQLQEFRWVQEKGILYVTFSTFEEAQGAMQGLSNYQVPGVSKGLNVKFSQKRF